jgi:hypothetical protein
MWILEIQPNSLKLILIFMDFMNLLLYLNTFLVHYISWHCYWALSTLVSLMTQLTLQGRVTFEKVIMRVSEEIPTSYGI